MPRIARESDRKRGGAFLSTVEEAVELAARSRQIGPTCRLVLAQAWTRSGLDAPNALEFTHHDAETAQATQIVQTPPDQSEADAMLDKLLKDVVRQTEGDAQAIYMALAGTFPTMPAPMREYVVAYATTRPEQVYGELGCFWLLDPSPVIRQAAAAGLAVRQDKGLLTAEIAARLVVLRSWMPEDEARRQVDQLLRDAMRLGVGQAVPKATWTVLSVLASLPDGSGAQSFAIALQSGRRRSVGMILLKQEHGVKDAYVIPCSSAGDQKAILQHLDAETGALPVSLDYTAFAVSMALGEGLAGSLPPTPGLVDVAAVSGLTQLRPVHSDTQSLLASLAAHDRIASFSPGKRSRLVDASMNWWDRHAIVENWFEDSDAVHEVVARSKTPAARERALWKWLETRRGWWAHVIARAAAILEAGGHKDAESFVATVMALQEGHDLKKIPVMGVIHEQTILACLADGLDMDFYPEFADKGEPSVQPPKPEGRNELSNLLKGAMISADWIDGFVMAMTVSPRMITPDHWLPYIIENTTAKLDPSRLTRLIDVVMMRANKAVELATDAAACDRRMEKLPKSSIQDWAVGFTAAREDFKNGWPAKATGQHDCAMLRLIHDAVTEGLDRTDLQKVGRWLSSRYDRSE